MLIERLLTNLDYLYPELQARYAKLSVGTEVEYANEHPCTICRAVVTQLKPLCMWHDEVVKIEVLEELPAMVARRGPTQVHDPARDGCIVRGLLPMPYREWLNLWWIRRIRLPE